MRITIDLSDKLTFKGEQYVRLLEITREKKENGDQKVKSLAPTHHNKHWSKTELQKAISMRKEGKSWGEIGKALGRTGPASYMAVKTSELYHEKD